MTREEAIGKWIYPAIATMWNAKTCNEILATLEQEPKAGHWIDRSGDDVTELNVQCSACGKWRWGKTNYCSNCGAKMESEEL